MLFIQECLYSNHCHTWITVAKFTSCLNAPIPFSILTDHSPDCPSFLTLWTCLLTVLLTLSFLVCTVVLIISNLFPYCELYELLVLRFVTESTQNMSLPYSPPLAWSTHVGSNTSGPYYHNRYRNRLPMLRHVDQKSSCITYKNVTTKAPSIQTRQICIANIFNTCFTTIGQNNLAKCDHL